MPYAEDGETWQDDALHHEPGMAENQPGHKPFVAFNLPKWAKHPLTQPSSGVHYPVPKYAYAAQDGIGNQLNWSPGHVAATYGDMEMLKSCTEEDLVWPDLFGQTPAHYAVSSNKPWVLQWMVENGVAVDQQATTGGTPLDFADRIWPLHAFPRENGWLTAALKGELTEKKRDEAVLENIKQSTFEYLDPIDQDYLDSLSEKNIYYRYKIGDYKPVYAPPQRRVGDGLDLPSSVNARAPPARAKPPLPVALLFTGVGSQYIGMLKDVVKKPSIASLLDRASATVGWDVKDVMLNGPEAKLHETGISPVLTFVACVAAVETLRQLKPEAVENPQAVAGLGVGEITALCVADVLSFEDCLQIVVARADAVTKAAAAQPQCACSVAGLERPTVERFCLQAADADKAVKAPVVSIGTSLFPAGFTCAGTESTVEALIKLSMGAKALQARKVKNSTGEHSSLMASAQEGYGLVIKNALPKMQPPRCAIYLNRTGRKVKRGTDPSEFLELIIEQITNEVLWEASMKALIMDGVKDFYECGPLKQLKAMMKRIDQDAAKRMESVSV